MSLLLFHFLRSSHIQLQSLYKNSTYQYKNLLFPENKKSLKRINVRFRLFSYFTYTSSNKCKTHLVSRLIQGILQYQPSRSKIPTLHLPYQHLQYVPNYLLHLLVMLRGRNGVFDIPFFFHMYDVIS